MTTSEPRQSSGYRGALPTRNDRLARPWLITVFAIFVLIFVLAALNVPSRFIPEPTAIPLPSGSLEPSASAGASASAPASPSASASASGSGSVSPSASAAP